MISKAITIGSAFFFLGSVLYRLLAPPPRVYAVYVSHNWLKYRVPSGKERLALQCERTVVGWLMA